MSQTKSRKTPTRKILPLFFPSRPAEGRHRWFTGVVTKLSGNITSTALVDERGEVVTTVQRDLVGDRVMYRILRAGWCDEILWSERSDSGQLTAREHGRAETAVKAKALKKGARAPDDVVAAHANLELHNTLHTKGFAVSHGAVKVPALLPHIMTAMAKTQLFNHTKHQNSDVPDDGKRRTRVLGIEPTADMPEELIALHRDVAKHMEQQSVVWEGGRFASMWSVLESMEGCQQQRHHTDYAPEDLANKERTAIPLSMMIAVEDNTKLCVWEDEYRHSQRKLKAKGSKGGKGNNPQDNKEFVFGTPKTVLLDAGDIAYWRGDTVYAPRPFNSTPMGGQFDFARPSASTPHGACV